MHLDGLRSTRAVPAIVGGRPRADQGVAVGALAIDPLLNEGNVDYVIAVIGRHRLRGSRHGVALDGDVGRHARQDRRRRVLHLDGLRSTRAVPAVVGGRPGADQGVAVGALAIDPLVRQDDLDRVVAVVRGGRLSWRRHAVALDGNVGRHARQGRRRRVVHLDNLRRARAVPAVVGRRPGADEGVAVGALAIDPLFRQDDLDRVIAVVRGGRLSWRRHALTLDGRVGRHTRQHRRRRILDRDRLDPARRVAGNICCGPGTGDGRLLRTVARGNRIGVTDHRLRVADVFGRGRTSVLRIGRLITLDGDVGRHGQHWRSTVDDRDVDGIGIRMLPVKDG